MSKILVFCGAVVLTIVAVVLVAVADVPLHEVLSLFLGVLCLLWLILLLTVPWNLYFQARALVQEIRTSRDRGIDVPAEREPEVRRIAARMRWFAIGSHLVSAGIVALITYLSGEAVGYYLAGLYLVSTFFRPAGAYFSYLRERLTTMLQDVKHPPGRRDRDAPPSRHHEDRTRRTARRVRQSESQDRPPGAHPRHQQPGSQCGAQSSPPAGPLRLEGDRGEGLGLFY
jgi:hypothetical protein